jgi:tetratricopeptide (TPR) repeat protein
MPRCLSSRVFPLLISFVLTASTILDGQIHFRDQAQGGAPAVHAVEPPAADATAESLEKSGDDLRAQKLYLDACDYYKAALAKKPETAVIYNKLGIAELQMQRWPEARKDFERAIKFNHEFSDAYNNLGVVYYEARKYGKALDKYQKAIQIRDDAASYYNNMGAAYFAKKDFEHAAAAYAHAFELDPDVFERSSRTGISAQLPKPEDRARYDYILAKLYAKKGIADRSLLYLRRAIEEGYKSIGNVYKDEEFAGLRKDPRFAELMASKLPGIPD